MTPIGSCTRLSHGLAIAESDMALVILRCVFLAVAIALGFQLLQLRLADGREPAGCRGSVFWA